MHLVRRNHLGGSVYDAFREDVSEIQLCAVSTLVNPLVSRWPRGIFTQLKKPLTHASLFAHPLLLKGNSAGSDFFFFFFWQAIQKREINSFLWRS